ncbi:MAG: ATP-binding protein [Gaiellaceae bacterium]
MSELPTGTVTFLFTDIEGSTRLLHELGDDYAEALAEHRRALRAAFARHGGVEVDTQGDAFFVAFAKASEALAAARDAQSALRDGPIRVRIGLHTGEPILTDEGYVGIDVHRAARIAAAGHGGQILVSQSTRDLTGGQRLRDLGEHRLKDLAAPERIFQLGDGAFPPLKTISNSNLPLSAEPLIGRKKELADVLRLLRDGRRLLTITGPGGIGKTRFALDVAAEVIDRFRDGVWWVGLAPVRDPMLVAPTIAAALGAKDLGELRAKRSLLLLDNLEQVVGAAPDIAELLQRCPDVSALVTSREPLHVAGEREYPLPPLPESPAVELFRQRAEGITPGFDGAYGQLVQLCNRLDRLPLAIELAAARTRSVSVEDLLRRLDQRLPVLISRRRDVDDRQRTLRATIAWSYDLLEEDEQRFFACLGVFAGSFDAAAAADVCDADLDLLESLVAKSLLRRAEDDRFFMLETIREFAVEQLAASSEEREVRDRHVAHALARTEPPLASARLDWLRSVERDYAELRGALTWLRDTGARDFFLRLAARLALFWDARAALREGRLWLEQALAGAPEGVSEDKVEAYRRLAHIALQQGDIAAAAPALDCAEVGARELGDLKTISWLHANRGAIGLATGDLVTARREYESALALSRQLGAPREAAIATNDLGIVALEEGDLPRARQMFEGSIDLARAMGDPPLEANALGCLALVAFEEGNLAQTWDNTLDAMRLNRAATHSNAGVANDLLTAAQVLARRGQHETACLLVGAFDRYMHETGAAIAGFARRQRSAVLDAAATRIASAATESVLAAGRERSLSEALDFVLSLDSN